MTIDNRFIIKKFKLSAKLMEFHGENEFKIRSTQKIVDSLEATDEDLTSLSLNELQEIEGIGKSSAEKIKSIVETGSFYALDEMLQNAPENITEMLSLPGFGPKKISTLWKDLEVSSLDDILSACRKGQVAKLKGFAEKSQETLTKAVEFIIGNRGLFRYASVEAIAQELEDSLKEKLPSSKVSLTGEIRRKMDIISVIEIVVGFNDFEKIRTEINEITQLEENPKVSGPFTWVGHHQELGVKVKIRFCGEESFTNVLMKTTGSIKHLNIKGSDGRKLISVILSGNVKSETELYDALNLPFIEPEMREGIFEHTLKKEDVPSLVEMSDLKGILHNHSTYSDGKHTLRQMAEHCKELGYEYLGITDHSQTAVYASGLFEYNIKQQQEEIQVLNEELKPFKIFSGIESDILHDGSLDYPDNILESFDFIVASVHSGLNMDINKATTRVLTAVRNPYTTILGHMTGRLLLEREGYPIDHRQIIHACAENDVVIEINASPYRLDIDWRWVNYALEKGVKLSINPDAHSMEGYQNMYYGLLAGRKGGLSKDMTLNALSVDQISKYFESRKAKMLA